MDKTTEELLDEVIREQLDDISTMSADNEARPKAISNVVELYKMRVEEMKLKQEAENKGNLLKEQKRDRCVKIALDSAGIIIPLVAYAGFFVLGLKYEQGGNMFINQTFKGLIHHFKPTR